MKTATILLVEDNPADQNLISRALEDGKIKTELRIVSDGEEAIHYLKHTHRYQKPDTSPSPDLILLDINLPKLNGKQVLEIIKLDPALKTIPVTILTTSSHEQDIMESYQLGVNAYVTKPVKAQDLFHLVQELENFWFHLTVLPPRS